MRDEALCPIPFPLSCSAGVTRLVRGWGPDYEEAPSDLGRPALAPRG